MFKNIKSGIIYTFVTLLLDKFKIIKAVILIKKVL